MNAKEVKRLRYLLDELVLAACNQGVADEVNLSSAPKAMELQEAAYKAVFQFVQYCTEEI